MTQYLSEKNVKLFMKKTLSTSVKLLIEIDELKANEANEGNEEKMLQIEKELIIINDILKSIMEYSKFHGYNNT